MEYYCQTDANGVRHDIDKRPELTCGSVEYLAPQEYMVRTSFHFHSHVAPFPKGVQLACNAALLVLTCTECQLSVMPSRVLILSLCTGSATNATKVLLCAGRFCNCCGSGFSTSHLPGICLFLALISESQGYFVTCLALHRYSRGRYLHPSADYSKVKVATVAFAGNKGEFR